MNLAHFQVASEKCVGCGRCGKVCPGGLLSLNGHRKAVIASHHSFGWPEIPYSRGVQKKLEPERVHRPMVTKK